MSYTDFYLSRKAAKRTGFGRRVWMLKLPRLATNPSTGESLLGTLVEEVDRFLGTNYPVPGHLTTPQLFLRKLIELRDQLAIPLDVDIVQRDQVSGATLSFNKNTNLDLEVLGNFPGVPIKLDLSFDRESSTALDIHLGDGAIVEYIPTDFLSRLARFVEGDDREVDPNVAVDIDDHLIVDMIVLARQYQLTFKQSKSLSLGFDVEADLINQEHGGKIMVTQDSQEQFHIDINGDQDYLIGFKTIDWDDLDWD